MKYLPRILAAPFIFVLFLIANATAALVATANFVRYGGEVVRYTKTDRATIHNIYKTISADFEAWKTKTPQP